MQGRLIAKALDGLPCKTMFVVEFVPLILEGVGQFRRLDLHLKNLTFL